MLTSLLEEIDLFILSIPNLVDDDVPEGKDETANKEIREIGSPREFNFTPKDHLDLSKNKEIDMEAGAKIAGSRFKVLRNDLALLQRSLISFMIDIHVSEHGYEEIYVPFIVNKELSLIHI